MEYKPFEISDINAFINRTPNFALSGIQEILTNAYNVIFETEVYVLPNNLSRDNLEQINKLIKSAFDIMAGMPYDPKKPKIELRLYDENQLSVLLHIAIAQTMHANIQSNHLSKTTEKRNAQKDKSPRFIYFISKHGQTAQRVPFKRKYGGTPEQIQAATLFYLAPFLKECYQNSDIAQISILLFKMTKLSCHIMKNHKQIAGGQKAQTITSTQKRAFKEFKKEYYKGMYKDIPKEEMIPTIMKAFPAIKTKALAKIFLKCVKNGKNLPKL